MPRVRDRVPGAHFGALGEQPRGKHQRGCLAQVVGVRLEGQSKQGDRLPAQLAEVLLELPDHPPLLELVHLDHRVQELEVVARVGGELLEGDAVLREARAAPADSGPQEVRPEPVIEPDPLGDLDHVGAGRLADVGDLVDEADPRHQERVRCQLDHLGRCDIRAHDRRFERLVERGHGLAVGPGERADDHTVGPHEVLDGAALGQELRVRHVADVGQTARVERLAHLLTGPDGHGALHHQQRALFLLRKLFDHVPDGREVGVAGVGRRRPDADEHQRRRREVGRVEREGQSLPTALEQLGEPRLVEGDPAGLQRLYPLGDDVPDDHLVPEVGEASAGHDADPAGAEDPNCRLFHAPEVIESSGGGPARSPASSRSRARRAACSRPSSWRRRRAGRPCAGASRCSRGRSGGRPRAP